MIGNHFLFRHSVDDHNNKRHSPISIEEIWATKWWPNRVFAFLLEVTEVNVSLGMVEFCDNAPTSQIEFRKKLADVLINNEYFNEEDDTTPVKKAKKQRTSVHSYCTLPKGKNFKIKCTTCTRRTRGYCKCSPGIYRCNECYALHLIGVENNLSSPC